jgi:hypothetical protein
MIGTDGTFELRRHRDGDTEWPRLPLAVVVGAADDGDPDALTELQRRRGVVTREQLDAQEWLTALRRFSKSQPRRPDGKWGRGGGGAVPPSPDLAKDKASAEGKAEANLQGVLSRSKASGSFDADKAWYHTAHDLVGQRADAAGIDKATFAGMVAATSPRALWQSKTGRYVNIEFAEKAAAHAKANPGKSGREVADGLAKPGMLRQSLASAIDIHNGKPVEEVLKGPKIRSFYNNLVDPDGTTHVTIDTHMVRAMLGDHNADDKAVAKFATGKKYSWSADRTRAVAKANGISPAEAQAAIWEQWRREG